MPYLRVPYMRWVPYVSVPYIRWMPYVSVTYIRWVPYVSVPYTRWGGGGGATPRFMKIGRGAGRERV